MKTDTRRKLVEFIAEEDWVTPHQLIGHFGLTAQAIHRHLRKLRADAVIKRIGWAPRVIYVIRTPDRA